MALKLGWSSLPDEWFGFGGSSANSPFEEDRYWIGVDFVMIKKKRKYFCFYKKKGYKYEDELGSKEIQQLFPGNGARNACWYFLTQIEIIHKCMEVPL
jgi:hypothetical protein